MIEIQKRTGAKEIMQKLLGGESRMSNVILLSCVEHLRVRWSKIVLQVLLGFLCFCVLVCVCVYPEYNCG